MKCVVGLSGGVDSAVTVYLMKRQGYDVIGCTLNMLENESFAQSLNDAHEIADYFGIHHHTVNCAESFKNCVINYFVNSYANGITPNPCVMCNKFIKLRYLHKFMKEQNAEIFATGHYARLEKHGDNIRLIQAVDSNKDQSYFLYRVDKDILLDTVFPLGDYLKSDVKKIANDLGLKVAKKLESQDICFVGNGDYISVINEHLKESISDGDIVTQDGKILGQHRGIVNYTVGQRKGLGLPGGPYFVCKIDTENNRIIVSDKNSLMKKTIPLKDVVFVDNEFSGDCFVKVRYGSKKIPATLHKHNDEFLVELKQATFGISPGQHCVFFKDDVVAGGGIISL